jgi:hypothetical protein
MKKYLVAAAAVGLIVANMPCRAQAETETCSGILQQQDGDLSISLPPEGICSIDKSENRKVLSVCKVGRHCRMTRISNHVTRNVYR